MRFLKTSKEELVLMYAGSMFQSLEVATMNDLSPQDTFFVCGTDRRFAVVERKHLAGV